MAGYKTNMTNSFNIERDGILLEAAMREAGALALGYFHGGMQGRGKDDGTPVSDADLSVDRLLHARLTAHRKDYGWLSEETPDSARRLDCRRVWIVDPIDGTRSFLAQKPWWSISVALVEDGVPVLGAVYAPVLNSYYQALRGGGTWLNGRRVYASSCEHIADCRIISSPEAFRPQRWRKSWPQMRFAIRNSVALRLAFIASGEFDVMFAPGNKSEWDMAAGDILVHEAGGVLSDFDGRKFTYNAADTRRKNLLAAGVSFHGKFLEQIRHNS